MRSASLIITKDKPSTQFVMNFPVSSKLNYTFDKRILKK